MSDDSDSEPQNKRKRKTRTLQDSPSSSSGSSEIVGTTSRGRRPRRRFVIDESDSDSGSPISLHRRRRKVPRVTSDADSDSSGSAIIKRQKRPARVVSESGDESNDSDHGFEGSSSSQWESCPSDGELSKNPCTKVQDTGVDSDSSDGQSEKCPICLVALRNQEIGSPESCDHLFCAECIKEWSKNMNTCPVDRQEYHFISVRKNINGSIYKQIPIEPPNPQNEVDNMVDDLTCCEICGSYDREHRMLLCDGCDLGFHLECLTPPLDEVPAGVWYCADCATIPPLAPEHARVDMYELHLLLTEAEGFAMPSRRRLNASPRLVPRTRHSERVRRRIETNRRNRNRNPSQPEVSLDLAQAVSSTSTARRTTTTRRKKKRKPRRRYRIVYKIDEATGETIAVKKKIAGKKRRKVKDVKERSVKRRLARQLGIVPSRSVPQNVPDVKVQTQSNPIGVQRHMAGIPALHLFGQRDELDYFSASDEDFGEGGLLTRRAPNRSDVAALRRVSRVKAVTLPNLVSSSSDLLGSIMDSQAKFHSKHTVLSLDSTGRVVARPSDSVRLDNYGQSIRRRPMYPNSTATNSDSVPSSSGRVSDDYQNSTGAGSDPNSSIPTSTVENVSVRGSSSGNGEDQYGPQDYSQRNLCSIYDPNVDDSKKDKKAKNPDDLSENNTPRSATPASESEIDIYSDIETVSTSRVDEPEFKPSSPLPTSQTPNTGTDDDNNDSEPDMVIDTEKGNFESEESIKEETTVTSTVDNAEPSTSAHAITSTLASPSTEIQSEAVQSSNQAYDAVQQGSSYMDNRNNDDDDSEDECPNFSIYSKESITLAKNTDISLGPDNDEPEPQTDQVGEISSSPAVIAFPDAANNEDPSVFQIESSEENEFRGSEGLSEILPEPSALPKKLSSSSGLYSDSEDETMVKRGVENSFGISDIRNMTEDISEEERSYTPCLDERVPIREGLEGLDTEMISDEDRNDFDESHDLKTVSDGDALEINAKESELDFTRPEDYEEGEIIDKTKNKKVEEPKKSKEKLPDDSGNKKASKKKDKEDDKEKGGNKENEGQNKESGFKKLSKSNKERNYRDKDKDRNDRDRSKSREKRDKTDKDKDGKRDRRKERRKEIERYDVRALIADKPRRVKDQFGRDIRRSGSRSSRSQSPKRSVSRNKRSPSKNRRSLSKGRRSISKSRRSLSKARRSLSKTRRSLSKGRRSLSREWVRKKRGRSRVRKTVSRSKSRSPERKRSRSKGKKRRRSSGSPDRSRRRKSRDRSKVKKKARSRSRHHSRSLTPKRRKEWNRRHSREWSPSLSRSRTPEVAHLSPSWTPPRILDNAVKPRNLTVILTNDSNKKKKEKKKKTEKKVKENERQKKRKRSEKTSPPSKEVFASGDNILVSVSFNKENETRDVSTKRKKDAEEAAKKLRKERRPKRQKKNRDLSGIKPVAIIDLERSPFKELTPSPKDVIVLSDSDNEATLQKGICDSSQQVASPETGVNNYATGPKTPPEPQVKFTLTSKPPQMRAISNPLHDPEDIEPEGDTQEVIDQRIDGHKGPNTPPEPPNSPPSSPDAYDPFEPTKSRSPTPEPLQTMQSSSSLNLDDNRDDNSINETRSGLGEMVDKSSNSISQTPDALKSHTPPLADVQPADSQSSIHATPESNLGKSPERSTGSSINQSVQTQPAGFTIATSKPVAQTIPFSSVPTSIITSTPNSSSLAPSRINILNTTIITSHVASSIPNRIVLPNPVKISPTKPAVKSTPIKPMPSKPAVGKVTRKSTNTRTQNGSEANDANVTFDSPYSPGSSDYEDLFEPPVEAPVKAPPKAAAKPTKSPAAKIQNTFDALFGSPFNKIKPKNDGKTTKVVKKTQQVKGKGTKQVGVKLDEDNLKILDDLPNSAVEMQVKDKFLKKLNRQERVVEEVKLVLKPHYNKKHINKEEYKDILRRAVPKICHNKSGEINPTKIKHLIEAYVKKIRHSKKVTSSSSVNPQKA